jgi:hypothetical protein
MEIDMTNVNTLADRYAQIKAEADAWAKKLEAVKAEIKDLGVEEVIGDHFTVTVSLSERSTLDQKKVKEILTPAQIAACNSVALVTTIRVKASVQIAA